METSTGAFYEVRLTKGDGRLVAILDRVEVLSYVKSLDLAGTFIVVMPDIYPMDYWGPDYLIQVWRRAPDQATTSLDFLGFLRRWTFYTSPDGRRMVMLMGYDQNTLLGRRIVAYAAGTEDAMIEALSIDDGMKKIVRENLGSLATDTDRDLTAAGLAVQIDLGQGATITKEHAWRNVGQLLRDLAQLSREQTPEILYWIRVDHSGIDGSIDLRFETSTGHLGRDLTQDRPGQSYLFGEELGNVANARLEYDYTIEANHAYAGGQGEGTERLIEEASDTVAESISPWSRIEIFVDARNSADADVDDKADQALAAGRPIVRFQADILDTPQAYYGSVWNLGDRIPILHRGRRIDALVRAVKVTLTADQQNIAAQVTEIIT